MIPAGPDAALTHKFFHSSTEGEWMVPLLFEIGKKKKKPVQPGLKCFLSRSGVYVRAHMEGREQNRDL